MKRNAPDIEKSYKIAKEIYAHYEVDTDDAIRKLSEIPVAIHCWQGDDVAGFETSGDLSAAGIRTTGNYPGKARNADELRADLAKALSLIPGRHRLNLHAIYAETGSKKVDRNELAPEHFVNWLDWARQLKLRGIDFNGTFFSHPNAEKGFTLSSRDDGIRKFWVQHAIACRRIGEYMAKQMASACVVNIWIPDGFKDIPVDRKAPRLRLRKSLDEIFADTISSEYVLDSMESKLFGIGTESYVVGSHEFYLAYAVKNNKLLCLDSGHFHPTEVVSDKISAVLAFLDAILLHVSRPVRWDSDHVVILSDELSAVAQEIVRGSFVDRVHIGLDFFDASINRVAAWVIGTRCTIKALLTAFLEPTALLSRFESDEDYTSRLAVLEELKTLPFGSVWDYYCLQQQVPTGADWLDIIRLYENKVLSHRH